MAIGIKSLNISPMKYTGILKPKTDKITLSYKVFILIKKVHFFSGSAGGNSHKEKQL